MIEKGRAGGLQRLAGRLSSKLRVIFQEAGQIGVAVSSGLEALASFTRQAALVLGKGGVFAKVDFMNAFNRVFRKAIAEAVLKHFTELARYVEAAGGAESVRSRG